MAEIIDHQLSTPGGTSLMGAATLSQLEQTSMKTWFEMMPKKFIKNYSKQKGVVDLINNHRIIFRPLDEESKARSLNLSAWHIEEASEVNYEYFTQLQTRLRSHSTKHHLGILSSNPDINWLKSEFLLKSTIHNATEDYVQDPKELNPNFSTHIAPTHLNIYLPPTFREDTAKGKPRWWRQRYLEGSFQNRHGLVYPMAQDHLVEPFIIPRHWERVSGADFGLQDPTVMLMGAIDPKDGTTYIYEEHYDNQKPVSYHAEQMLKMLNKVQPGLLRFLVADPKGKARSENDMKSTYDHYAEYGVHFQPGVNKIEDGIMKVYTYFALGKLKIFKTCYNTVREVLNYKYPERQLNEDKNAPEKPLDKDNHTTDTIRYIVMELPDDPQYLVNESFGYFDTQKKQHDHLPHALQEDDTYDNGVDYYSYY